MNLRAQRPTHSRRPRGDAWFLAVLVALAGLAALLWFLDPSHSLAEKSRVPWPERKTQKP
jgi:hypothetical protein